jgi:hypothetical protein
MKVLPESFLRCMRPKDRAELGRAGQLQVEVDAKAEVKSERDLQRLIDQYLRLRGVVPIRSRMDRKTSNNVGTPDFLFAVRGRRWDGGDQRVIETVACAFEVKLPGKKLDPEQEKMRVAMTKPPNGWHYHVVHSVEEVKAILDRIQL